MSVINQMLKDLEKRNSDGTKPNVIHVPTSKDKSSKTVLVSAIVISVLITLLVAYLVVLRQENSALKVQSKNELTAVASPVNSSKAITQQFVANEPNSDTTTPKTLAQESVVEPLPIKAPEQKVVNTANVEQPIEPTIIEENASAVAKAPAEKRQLQADEIILASEPLKQAVITQKTEQEATPPPSSLTISRKQFSPKELAAQKMKKAEKAMMDKDLLQAEALFGDVLLLLPEDITARKQLAALWFGRQQYQDALNLLSRGIELAPADTEFRLMQARIYLTQQHNEAAFLVLSSLQNAPDVEYQSLLANTAQALSKFEDAEKAYTLLITMQPQQSRWHLGLAIALDKQSEFDKAITAYKSAITLGGLSNSTMQFAVQRLKDLGE